MARFRSKEARLVELEKVRPWVADPNIDMNQLRGANLEEYIVYQATGEVGKVFSEDMTAAVFKEIINHYKAGEIEQVEVLFRQNMVDRKD